MGNSRRLRWRSLPWVMPSNDAVFGAWEMPEIRLTRRRAAGTLARAGPGGLRAGPGCTFDMITRAQSALTQAGGWVGAGDAYAFWSGSVKVTWRVRSPVPRKTLSSRVPPRAAASASNRSSGVRAGWPAAATIRSPEESPLDAGDEPERPSQPAPAWVGQGEHRLADLR